jgi:hypothetical protein
MALEPTLEVMMSIALVKSTVRPLLSVSRPSSVEGRKLKWNRSLKAVHHMLDSFVESKVGQAGVRLG